MDFKIRTMEMFTIEPEFCSDDEQKIEESACHKEDTDEVSKYDGDEKDDALSDDSDGRLYIDEDYVPEVTVSPSKELLRCSLCSYKTRHLFHLNIHNRVHTGEKPYSCNYCDYIARTTSHLYRHIASHSGVKPYSCPDCGYRACQASDITRHRIVHTGVRKHSCTVCNCNFTRESHLKTHMLTHTDDRPHVCPHCDYRSNYAAVLRKHIGRKHKTNLKKKSTQHRTPLILELVDQTSRTSGSGRKIELPERYQGMYR